MLETWTFARVLRLFGNRCTGLAALVIGSALLFGCGGNSLNPSPTSVPKGQLLEFTTLHHSATGIGSESEILIKEGASEGEVLTLLKFLRDVERPDGFLLVRVFDSHEAWRLSRACAQAWKGLSVDRVEGRPPRGPDCEAAAELTGGLSPFVGTLSRNPRTGYAEIEWLGSEE